MVDFLISAEAFTLTSSMHPLAPDPLPFFVTSSDGTDYLLIGIGMFLVIFALAIGLLYLHLHALPDHIAHKSQKVQYEVVCVLGLLAMFTQIHAFWIAGLLLAFIDIPDFGAPLRRIAGALETIASNVRRPSTRSETAATELAIPQLSPMLTRERQASFGAGDRSPEGEQTLR